MSARRKLARAKLNPVQVAAAKRALRCPDCDSRVVFTGRTHADIEHDDTCPTRAELVATGRAYGDAAGALMVAPDGQTAHVSFGKFPGLDVPVTVFSDSPYRQSRA